MDELTPTASIAGAANAVLVREDGSLLGDQFDGAGFVRGVQRKGFALGGTRALVVGNGGVGSPIAASLAAAGVTGMGLFDPHAARLRRVGGAAAGALPGDADRDRFEGPGRLRPRRQRHADWA